MIILDPTVSAALGIRDMSDHDQVAYFSEHGDIIFATVLEQFEPLLSEPEQQELSIFLNQEPEPEELLNYLALQYDNFVNILESVARTL